MIYIVCVGNLKEKYLSEACNEYLKRINRYEKIEIVELKESLLTPYNVALKAEANEINKYLKGYVIKMAIKGKQLSSEELAGKLESVKLSGNSDITFVIGSSHGLDESVKSNFDLSISKMTFPHQLTRVILLEQVYRALSILNHSPYHK
ncbi:MAG: 23S rRNA (pseudouridine(1915)-N(3))-methyltransferase RlmH [Bacilli bacterium]|nr:23S rRNA (pseudouridine(1915)-N(3))-methyltransferase RlmH [Bacilli bacterium]